ncbi:agmatine deiminase [Vibrio sp.]|uniref:Putative agmatine deiminase n=1 Tax=Vibrio viridaestus TaxID=2487322 RepID=A0A3N9TL15_9VIBR|nr:agmatine deiminase [Vibrio viridaestus]MDC0612023.1 agmatine deiminase [Vibrio sp.]RQW64970.1 agmatine deiminase [Vibrio viridaestus]
MDNRVNLPVEDGFRMPGEHEPHDQVWMAWPVRADNWRDGALPAQKAFCTIASAIAEKTSVVMAVDPEYINQARESLPSHITVVEMDYNDSWMRDMGATYVTHSNGERRGISWRFNAWGGEVDGLYSDWALDDLVAEKMASTTGDKFYQAPIFLEGGSIHVDGEGTLYTTEECLLHPSRNPDLSKQQIEQRLAQYLGIKKVIWLPLGLFNDETNGHVDNIMHVVKPGEVMLAWCDDPSDPQYDISRKAFDVLSSETDAQGRRVKVYKLPLPRPMFITQQEADGIEPSEGMKRQAGERMACSYANFLITNGLIVYPLLDETTDLEARNVLQEAFPDYDLIGIPTREVALGGGNIHCITQQVPRRR